MILNKPIGGYFELELPNTKKPLYSEDKHLLLSSGRACLKHLLLHLKPSKIHVPYYICSDALTPIIELGIPIMYYSINSSFEPVGLPSIKNTDEYFLLINYFGLKSQTVKQIYKQLSKQLIVDNSQAFYDQSIVDWYFNSARKYFGVPDGAYLYASSKLPIVKAMNKNIEYNHLIKRTLNNTEEGYSFFIKNEQQLNTFPQKASLLSQKLLNGIDYKKIRNIRRNNFKTLNKHLSSYNQIQVDLDEKEVPMCYPFWNKKNLAHSIFHKEKIYIPTLWKNVFETSIEGFEYEKKLAKYLLPLPLDQRYSTEDMLRMITFIKKLI